jgi:hypothetical protein
MIPQRTLLVLFVFLSVAASALAQPTSAPATIALGEKFQSQAAGISFRPPAGMKQLRGGALGSSEIVRFESKEKKWLMVVTVVQLDNNKPLPLSFWKDDDGKQQPGMLEVTVDQFKAVTPGAQILKQFPDDTRQPQIGFMAAKYSFGFETNLMQQAIIRASNLRYYILSFTSAVPREGDLESSPAVVEAVHTFDQVVQTVELSDLSDVRQDQEERLFRTRTLFVNLNEPRLRKTLVPEQWLRFIQDGKDVGYSYVIQEVARDLPRKGKPEVQTGPEGVLVGIRSRLIPEPGVQTDAESWFFMTFDRKFETFSTVVYGQKPRIPNTTSGEVGVSRWREKPIPIGDGRGKREMIQTDDYHLEVTRIGPNVSSEPVERDLPPYYLPQALYQILPVTLPRNEAKTYLFASWITEVGQVVHRYIDVEREQEVNLAGRHVRAIPIRDKVGLQGSVTTHYVSPDGKYLGSVNEDSKMTVLSTDAATLGAIWQNANLTRPGDVDQKK